MKNLKIAGISIWLWLLSALLIGGGIYWMTIGRKTPKPSDDAVKCHLVAREMLRTERSKALVAVGYRKSKETGSLVARDLEKSTREYEKLLARLKQNESMLSHESSAIESWVMKGRELNKSLPRNSADLLKAGEAKLSEIDRKWELFFEADIVDILEGE